LQISNLDALAYSHIPFYTTTTGLEEADVLAWLTEQYGKDLNLYNIPIHRGFKALAE
jgi:hypothetical protein